MKEYGSEEKESVLLPLPLGEVARRSRDGEGPLSQPAADSSPGAVFKFPI